MALLNEKLNQEKQTESQVEYTALTFCFFLVKQKEENPFFFTFLQ